MVDRMMMIKLICILVYWIESKNSAVENWRTGESAKTDVWSPATKSIEWTINNV